MSAAAVNSFIIIAEAMPTQANQPLADDYQLQNYRIGKVLSCGGFSIVYLAYDENEVPVAIKEYLPSSLALRDRDDVLPAVAAENLAAFRYGMKCFFEEVKSLARLAHSNVVRVLNFFRANETVYMVMRYERGRTLQEHIQRHRGAIGEDFIRRVFTLLLNGLREVHTNKLLHLDIKPANIYIRNDDSPVLIDFGAARQMLSEQLSLMYTPGFAAPEQYGKRALLGPWSDIYSVGATMYACLGAGAPLPADQRMDNDKHVPARKLWGRKYTEQLLQTIDWCLRLDHLRRPQSVFALQKALLGERDPVVSLTSRTADFRELVLKLASRRSGR
jgi:serine/threonine protein kinase